MASATTTAASAIEPVPKFSLEAESRYDQSTYLGRVKHFMSMVNLKNNFLTQEELADAKKSLEEFKRTKTLPPGKTDEDMWEARRKVSAVFHPDTGEEVPLPFRLSAFMPVNLPTTAGMLLATSTPAQLIWQFVNQTYNSAFNYANRNASVPLDLKQLAASYAVATGTAVGAAYGLGKVVSNLQAKMAGSGKTPGFGLKLLSRGLPWLAVATAGSANALAMRYKEGIEGITVFDENNKPMGTSVAAGRYGLVQVALVRIALPVPILLLPPFILDALKTSPGLGPLMARSKPARTLVELAVIAAFLQGALPFAVALFPQKGSISADKLEEQFRAPGMPSTFYFNKGV